MNAYELMMRLGLPLGGTNADLIFVAPPNEDESGEDESGEDEESDEDEAGEDEESDEDEAGEDEESDEDEAGEDGEDEAGEDEESDESEESDDSDDSDESDESDESEESEESDDSDESEESDEDEAGEDEAGEDEAGEDEAGEDGEGETDGEGADETGGGGGADGGASTEEEFDPAAFAAALLAAIQRGDKAGVKDLAEALAEAVKAAHEDADGGVEWGESLWNPYTTDKDVVKVVSTTGPEAQEAGRKLLESVRQEVSFLRARLRNKFLEAKQPRVMHGVKNGDMLSERLLANTWVEVQSGISPTRPDTRTVHRDKVSVAVAVVVDQSGSMSRRQTDAARALTAICAPLDEVGCPVLAVGFREGAGNYPDTKEKRDPTRPYHRYEAVHIDVFKSWEEPVRNCLGRFTKVKAVGGTPMSDGIQFALQALSERKERHRILLVITDGAPDYGHDTVIRRQQRLAREAGISIIGVGIDAGCEGVKVLYDKHVAVKNVSKLPEKLLAIINELVFPRGPTRKVVLDGKMNMRAQK